MDAPFGFWKMAGGGNDFIVIDAVSRAMPALDGAAIRRLCARALSIGADGLIALSRSEKADVRMLHWNSDGGANDYCGNGTRCAARFAYERGLTGPTPTLETGAGILWSRVMPGGIVRAQAPAIAEPPRPVRLSLPAGAKAGSIQSATETAAASEPHELEASFAVVGVPHLIVEAEAIGAADVREVDIAGIGPALRRHPSLGPAGANVNFVHRLEDGTLEIRTWERGVEGETLSCGSGAIAASLWLRRATGGSDPVVVRTRSGVELTVGGLAADGAAGDPWLEGDARIVYRALATDESDPGARK